MVALLVPCSWILAMLYSFYCQALVCEEYFVPALNVVIDRFKIPDDVAGATLMAMGTSAPELFCSLIALFVTHTVDTGVGTIVGSDLFNMLMICGGSAIVAGELHLEWTVLARELLFYGLSILLLYTVMKDHIITTLEGGALVGAYVFYAIVCCVQAPIMRRFLPEVAERLAKAAAPVIDVTHEAEQTKDDLPDLPSARPRGTSVDNAEPWRPRTASSGGEKSDPLLQVSTPTSESTPTDGVSRNSRTMNKRHSVPISLTAPLLGHHGGYLLERAKVHLTSGHVWYRCYAVLVTPQGGRGRGPGPHLLRCDTYQEAKMRSEAAKIRKASSWNEHMWQEELERPRNSPGWGLTSEFLARDKSRDVPLVDISECKAVGNHEFHLFFIYALNPVVFSCSSEVERDAWVHDINMVLLELQELEGDPMQRIMGRRKSTLPTMSDLTLDMPRTRWGKFQWALTVPARVMFHYTIPDVKEPTMERYYGLAILAFLIWLPILSYVMVVALNEVSAAWDLPPALMALTIGAAGTSFPDFIASLVVAKEGQGNMAVSNAFGSNIFNIFFASGAPWLLYCLFCLSPEDDLAKFTKDGSIGIYMPSHEVRTGVITLAVSLILFLLILIQQKFVLKPSVGWFFAVCWLAYVGVQVLEVEGLLPQLSS